MATVKSDIHTHPMGAAIARLLSCGFLSGTLQAIVFNPWDRALYLSVRNNIPFLHRSNFNSPWQGLLQTIFQRAISAGSYFPLEELFANLFSKFKILDSYKLFLSGACAGATNGLIMNPASAIKVINNKSTLNGWSCNKRFGCCN